MKNIILFALLGIMIASCSKTEERSDIICDTELNCVDEDCLFTLDNSVGTTTFLNCYGHWTIKVTSINDGNSWYIVDDWDASYEQEGLQVTFCGYVRKNTRPLLLPDPMPGAFYQIELENIELSNE